jgi:sugar lactone lactonase YvrE
MPGGRGSTDGNGSTARFLAPSSVAVDASGNVYVADKNSNTIRKVTSSGVVTTLAGLAGIPGSRDGTGSNARFNNPSGVAVDSSGNVYVADTYNNIIRKVTPSGVVCTLAGFALNSGSTDGLTSNARFNFPSGIAVDGSGNVYVADQNNNTLRKLTPGGLVTTLAGLAGSSPGSSDGTGSAARFNSPNGLAVDASGNIYVADTDNHTVRKVTPAGVVTTLAGQVGNFGSSDGSGSAAQFSFPYGVTVDGSGNVFVADQYNFTIRKVTSAGVVTTLAGRVGVQGSSDGTGSAARFYQPSGVTVDGSGNVFVADSANYTIRKVTSGGVVSTLAGLAPSPGSTNGTGSSARLNCPFGVAVEGGGNVYVADTTNHTIRKVTPAGVVSTLAGLAGNMGSSNGTGSSARFYSPTGVALDSSGNIYVVDQGNHTIRKVTSAGVVTTLAGLAGSSGSSDGTGSAARFNNPTGVAVDGGGNLYVSDTNNSIIRKVTPGGLVSTLAGLAGNSGNVHGTGSNARFNFPTGVAVNGSGTVFIADTNNNNIRYLTTDGLVENLAGGGEPGSIDNYGDSARFNRPSGVAVDSSGNLYVADQGNSTIRKITPAAWGVYTIGGTAGVIGSADGLGVAAQFSRVGGIAVSSSGTVFVADSYNNRISMGVFVTPPVVVTAAASSVTGTGATLNGTVNATGFSTAVSFDYGLTGAYGSTVVGTPTPVTGSSATGVSAAISGLSPGTLYHYRVNGTNSGGTTHGGELTFTTAFTPTLWRQYWYGTTSNSGNAADSADPYNTGVTNLIVFAIFGQYRSPISVSAALLPQPRIIGTNYVISFNEPEGVSNISYGAQYATSISPANWQPVADTGSGTQHIFSVPIAGNPQLFMRLVVTNLSP